MQATLVQTAEGFTRSHLDNVSTGARDHEDTIGGVYRSGARCSKVDRYQWRRAMTCWFVLAYLPVMFYSMMCAPVVWFQMFDFRDSPEYAFAYFIGCIILGITLLGALIRIGALVRGAVSASESIA
jgi:hypothetical protein